MSGRDLKTTVLNWLPRSDGPPEYLQQFVESEIKKWAVPIKMAGAAGQ
jgi:hypothetical protein